MAFFLITSIDSVIMRSDDLELKIGLRTLKVFLLLSMSELQLSGLSRKLRNSWSGYDVHSSLVSRIQVLLLQRESEMASEVHNLEKEVDDALWNSMSHSSLLTVDEVLEIVRVVADSATDSLHLFIEMAEASRNSLEVIAAFRVHTRIMISFLCFAVQTGVELENVLFHIKPIVINAARVFITADAHRWCEDVESNCLVVNRMASDPQVYQAYSQALATSKIGFTPSQDVLEDFLDSLISLLWDVLRHSHSDSRSEHPLKVLYERLRFTRATLRNFKDEMIMGLIRDAGVLIYSHHQPDPVRLSDLLQWFDVLQANEKLPFGVFTSMKITDDGNGRDFDTCIPISSHQPPQSTITPPVVGFQLDEVTSVLDRLTRGSKQLRIVQISGMAGLGKTTFALQLYNHPSILQYFWARAWCPISQTLDKKKVLLQLLNQIHESESHFMMTVDDLANKLRKSLKGKRYLIFLDDVWTPQVWKSLEASFPNDATGSRIILTSRNVDIATSDMIDEKPHLLRLREDNECLKILETKLKHKEGWNSDVGMKIAKKCKGLPLTLCIVAGALATMEQGGWKGILDQLGSGVAGAESALELSYEHIPDYLQPCFLYFGVFPEDGYIYVKRLIQLWMAAGFVQENDLRMEDVAREYMKKLIERSLVMVVESRSIGGVKICRIHDLVHDFCRIKAKKESFFHLLSDFNEPCNLQRWAIHSDAINFQDSWLFCPREQSISFIVNGNRCLFDLSFIIQIFQLLQVLDISQIDLESGIPSEIDRLTQLRFLSISSKMPVIPSSVGNLSNLETFIALVHSSAQVSFPQTLWNLGKLKYLYFYCFGNGCTLPAENLENFPSLLELETLCGVVFYSDEGSMEEQMRKFPNIRTLKCVILPRTQSREVSHEIVVPEFLSKLESLTISGSYKVVCVFGSFPESLRKLKMAGFELSKEEIAVIRKLPNLEVLKLHTIRFAENILDMEEEGFLKLRILELDDHFSTLERWTASNDQLPCLEKVVFRNCRILKEIPCCLEISTTLEEIQVYKCSSTLESLVRYVEEVCADSGNSIEVHTSQ